MCFKILRPPLKLQLLLHYCNLYVHIMPRKSILTDFEKGRITALAEDGYIHRKIAAKLNRSKSAVTGYLQRCCYPKICKKVGRKHLINARHHRQIIRHISTNPSDSLMDISHTLGLRVSKPTMWRTLKLLQVKYRKMKASSCWRPRHLMDRLNFAKRYISFTDEWKQVIFSDEKRITWMAPIATRATGTF